VRRYTTAVPRRGRASRSRNAQRWRRSTA
jgi:hypothetical protein